MRTYLSISRAYLIRHVLKGRSAGALSIPQSALFTLCRSSHRGRSSQRRSILSLLAIHPDSTLAPRSSELAVRPLLPAGHASRLHAGALLFQASSSLLACGSFSVTKPSSSLLAANLSPWRLCWVNASTFYSPSSEKACPHAFLCINWRLAMFAR